MKNKPLISVIMPVYNSELYVEEAIKSILNQTYSNFEFIIIDDGSTDNSTEIINTFKDSRIRFFQNNKNLGVSNTLNFGIDVSSGELIARMDADDISVKDRFDIQRNQIKKENCIVLGSSMIPFKGSKIFKKTIEEKNNLLAIVDPFFSHPTVLMKKDFLVKETLKYKGVAEDYYLWSKILNANNYNIFTFKNLDIPLLYYRISNSQVTETKMKLINDDALQIRRNAIIEYFQFHNYSFQFSKDYGIDKYDFYNISQIFQDLRKKFNFKEIIELERKVIFYFFLSGDLNISIRTFSAEFSKFGFSQKLKVLNSLFFNKKYIKRF